MSVAWNLYRFDYSRYVQIRPYLRSAKEPAEFAALSEGPETDAIVEALIEGELDVIGARHEFLIASCCVGEPLPCTKRMPAILRKLRQDVRTEEGIEMLADAFVAGRNLETWLLPYSELLGFLTPPETQAVFNSYRLAETRYNPERQNSNKSPRRGGLLPSVAAFARLLFDRGLATDELYRLLGEFLEEAAEHRQGLAVVAA